MHEKKELNKNNKAKYGRKRKRNELMNTNKTKKERKRKIGKKSKNDK